MTWLPLAHHNYLTERKKFSDLDQGITLRRNERIAKVCPQDMRERAISRNARKPRAARHTMVGAIGVRCQCLSGGPRILRNATIRRNKRI
jgi:hypothetical protein